MEFMLEVLKEVLTLPQGGKCADHSPVLSIAENACTDIVGQSMAK